MRAPLLTFLIASLLTNRLFAQSVEDALNGTYDYYSFSVTTTTPRYAIFDIDYTTSGFDSHIAIWSSDGTLLGHNDDYDYRGGAGGSTSDLDSLHALYLMTSDIYIVGVARSAAGPGVGGFEGNAPETGDRYYLHVSVEGQPVPEPASVSLLGIGGLCLLGRFRSQAKRKKAQGCS